MPTRSPVPAFVDANRTVPFVVSKNKDLEKAVDKFHELAVEYNRLSYLFASTDDPALRADFKIRANQALELLTEAKKRVDIYVSVEYPKQVQKQLRIEAALRRDAVAKQVDELRELAAETQRIGKFELVNLDTTKLGNEAQAKSNEILKQISTNRGQSAGYPGDADRAGSEIQERA